MACLALLLPSFSRAETLEQLISSALQNHPAIQAQLAQQQAAKIGVDSASWQFYPTPSVAIEKAGANATDPLYRGNSTVSTLRLQQPLWTGGRLTAGKEKAEAGVTASQASVDEARQQLALRVVQVYGDWLAAHLKIKANEKSMATHVRLRDQVKRRIEQGASAESDLTLAVTRLKAVAADVAVSQAQKDMAVARLEQLLGRPVDGSALSAATAARAVAGDRQTLLAQALALNPAVRKAQAQARAQESAIAERRADLSPEVYLRGERQYGNYVTATSSAENRVFVGLSSRFGAGLSTLSEVEGARAQYQAALAEVEAQCRAISEQVLADHALAASLEGRLDAMKASFLAAGQVAESYDRQFLAGRKTWLDVMNAARELAQSEVQLADIQATQVVVSWRLAIYTQSLPDILGGKP